MGYPDRWQEYLTKYATGIDWYGPTHAWAVLEYPAPADTLSAAGTSWAYDATRVNLHAYEFHDPADGGSHPYLGFSVAAAEVYWNNYVDYNRSQGGKGAPGYRVYTPGALMWWRRTALSTWATRVQNQAVDGTYTASHSPDAASQILIREYSYALRALVDAYEIDPDYAGVGTRLTAFRDALVDMAEDIFVDNTYTTTDIGPYFFALMAEAFIRYLQVVDSSDQVIKDRLVSLADYLCTGTNSLDAQWWDAAEEAWLYWHTSEGGSVDLNHQICPVLAYAWKYLGGTEIWQTIGDAAWAHGVDGYNNLSQNPDPTAPVPSGRMGKQFNQQYFWSMDYANWRHGSRHKTYLNPISRSSLRPVRLAG